MIHAQFNCVLIMDVGCCAFYGAIGAARAYFEGLGYCVHAVPFRPGFKVHSMSFTIPPCSSCTIVK